MSLRANIFRSGVLRTSGRDSVRRPAPSLFAFLGLEARPWHDTRAPAHRDWAEELERQTPRIGEWEWRSFIKKGEKDSSFARACPHTACALEAVPGLQTGVPFAYTFFSSLGPGANIAVHTAPCNIRLRGHLPLIVPEGDVGITVGGETRQYTEGKLLLFDDAYPHETWHRGSGGEDRVVLLFDIWHPDLTEEERADVQGMFEVAHAQNNSQNGGKT